MNDIAALLTASSLNIDALASALDATNHNGRMAAMRHLTPKIQSRLFEAAEGRPVPLEAMVGPERAGLEEVIHEGINTLPSFRQFQKRFCRPSRDPESAIRLWGYNEQTFRPFSGPGYFVGYEDHVTGEFWIDYRELPPERPADWPEIISNRKRLGIVIYAGMVDKMRRVSEHVTIGRAFKKGKPMKAWFTLVRVP